MTDKLTASDSEAIFNLVYDRLRDSALPDRIDGEAEPLYTARAVQPILARVAKSIGIPGLVVGGHGMGPTHEASLMGLRFIPDAEVSFRGQRMIAIENKFIGTAHRQRQITSAIGQATMYALAGYRFSIGLMLDACTVSYPNYKDSDLRVPSEQIRFLIKRRNHIGQFVSEQ